MILVLPLCGYTLKGGVTYTVEQARKEAFARVQYFLPKSIIEANMFDPNFKDNVRAIKNKITETTDRFIVYFSDGSYSIVYKKICIMNLITIKMVNWNKLEKEKA